MPLVIINLYSDIKSISSAMPTFQFNRRQFYYLKGHNRRSQRCFPVFVCVAGYCMWTTLRRYKHPLGTTIARPCISKAVTRIAKSENAFIIVHDATGKATTTSIPTSSYESGILENSDTLAPKQIYKISDDPLNCSTEPEEIEVNSDQEYHPSYVRKLKNNEDVLTLLRNVLLTWNLEITIS
ncbi:uncharacterized protein LOC122565741 isoform X3 [Bombus pyrosoma]|uniref:uncharacterized protein LOC122565741 isoform X3 n=1 Tax=Bombus pyrosoma TaxID=396416 RepID=UPI001CB9635A|nr:uncharacterized protein LOC122565741 isoform X3 [Bombus pyrosoma]